jgi:hypothetical protein
VTPPLPAPPPEPARPWRGRISRVEDAPFVWGVAVSVAPAVLLAAPLTLVGARLYDSGIGFAGLGGIVWGAGALLLGAVATLPRRTRTFGLGMLTGSLVDLVVGGCVSMLPTLWS